MDTLIKKKAAARSWISVDRTGRDTTLEDVDKYSITSRVQIHARDLRILDPLSSFPSAILGRERAIVVNLEHIKAIITAEEVLLQDPTDDNVCPIVEEFKRRLPPAGAEDESSFEFRALEVALEGICDFLDARMKELETNALDLLASKGNRKCDRVRKLIKCELMGLTARVQKVRDELKKLLKYDSNMANLYLSRKLASLSPIRGSTASAAIFCGDCNELKILLEPYFMQADRTLNKSITLREKIDDMEDDRKNQLKALKLILELGTFCVAMYSVVPGIFGMNIPFKWDHAPNGFMFKWVVILPVVVCAAFFVTIVSYARRKGLGSC